MSDNITPVETSSSINTDGRTQYSYKSKYEEKEVRKHIRYEAAYLVVLYLLANSVMFLNYMGLISDLFKIDDVRTRLFEYIIYFTAAGLLGGIVFGIKYFYRVIAHGYWHYDRQYWRLLSPLISATIAFIVACMVSSGLLGTESSYSNAWAIAFGFFSGYFADEAVGKMYEIATFVFGKNSKK